MIRDHFGDGSGCGIDLTYSHEEELLGTAGGVRNVAEFLGDVLPGDLAATPSPTSTLRRCGALHESHGGVATLAVKRVADTTPVRGRDRHRADGRVQGFQEKPDPAEALSDLANCGIYVFEPEIFDYFPGEVSKPQVPTTSRLRRLGEGRLPGAARPGDVPSTPTRSTPTGTTSAISTSCARATSTPSPARWRSERARRRSPPACAPPATLAGAEVAAPALVGAGVELGTGVRIDGPAVIGDGSRIGAGACDQRRDHPPGCSPRRGGDPDRRHPRRHPDV